MSQAGKFNDGTVAPDIETLTGDAGGAIGADAAFNINLQGNTGVNLNGIQFTGNPATNTLTALNLRNITSYVVDATAGATEYQTIQAALNAANTAGGNATVYVRHGTYTEDLTLYDTVFIEGQTESGTTIVGTHTPPVAGIINIRKVTLQDATAIFSSAAAGTTTILIEDCAINVNNGYTFNLLNWTGTIAIFDIGNNGTNDGFLNNTGGAPFLAFSTGFGNGTVNSMIISGTFEITTSDILCPISFQGAATGEINTSSFGATITTAATATVDIYNSSISTGATAAISHGSANPLTLSDVTIDSSNNPAITGAGAGNLILGSVTYLSNSNLAGTLTISRATKLDIGSIEGTAATLAGAFAQTAGTFNVGQDNAANAINIGGGTTARAIGIGNSAAAHILTIGSTTGAASLTLQSGTGSISLTSTGTGDITIDSDDTLLLDADGVLELNSSAGVIGIGNDADAQSINIGTGAAARIITIGNITGATAVNINTGTAGSAITTTNGVIGLISGTGAINIGADAAAKTITVGNGTGATSVVIDCGTGALNIGTNAIARTTTLGNTTAASVLALRYGTGDFTLASATGTVMNALDTGEITYPLQSAFSAFLDSTVLNVTGNGAAYQLGTTALTEIFDQNADFNVNGTFTSPVTGRYALYMGCFFTGATIGTRFDLQFTTSNRNYYQQNTRTASANDVCYGFAIFADMDAGDTAVTVVTGFGEAGDTQDISGIATHPRTYFQGSLEC